MSKQLRRTALWLAQQLLPARGSHRHRAPSRAAARRPTGQPLSPPHRFGLREPHPPQPTLHGDDVPLVRPYVLSAEEWARRRTTATARKLVCAP